MPSEADRNSFRESALPTDGVTEALAKIKARAEKAKEAGVTCIFCNAPPTHVELLVDGPPPSRCDTQVDGVTGLAVVELPLCQTHYLRRLITATAGQSSTGIGVKPALPFHTFTGSRTRGVQARPSTRYIVAETVFATHPCILGEDGRIYPAPRPETADASNQDVPDPPF